MDRPTILALLDEAGGALTGLSLLDGMLVLRIARGRKAGQVRVVDTDAGDAARCGLAVMIVLDPSAGALCAVASPRGKSSSAGRRCSRR